MNIIAVKNIDINVTRIGDDDYVSLTDIARAKNPKEPNDVVKNWMRLRSSPEFLGIWETLSNPNFNRVEFDPLLAVSGKKSFTMSPTRWINEFNVDYSKAITAKKLVILNKEANREKELFNKNNVKPAKRIEKK